MTESKIKNKKSIQAWEKILRTSLKLPGAKLDRNKFLKYELANKFSDKQISQAIETSPANAGIALQLIDEIAEEAIKWQTVQVTSLSFLAGLPGGLAMAGTIPADMAQFYLQLLVLAQKLAYLYGWPELFDEEKEISEETLTKFTVFAGVMFGATGSGDALNQLIDSSKDDIDAFNRKLVVNYSLMNLAQQIAKWISVKITRGTLFRSVAKIVPFLGGIVSGGMSYLSITSMSNRLTKELRKLDFAKKIGS